MAIKTDAKKDFLKIIAERAQKKRNPIAVMFELTYRCNFRCLHCYIPENHRDKEELGTREIFSVLDGLKEAGVYSVGFTGGEPLIREDIFDILDYANRCGFRFSLLTNGHFIDEKTAKKLKHVNVDKIKITLNAMNSKIFNEITQSKGSFKRIKRAVSILKDKNMQVEIQSTCMKTNKDEIIKINKFARSLGVLHRIDGEILPCRTGCITRADKYSISAKEYDALRRKVHPEMFEGNRPQSKTNRRKNKMFNCGVGQTTFSVNPYGKMNFCLETDYPGRDILTDGTLACWAKLKKEADRLNNIKDFVCRDCDLLKYCAWCPGRSYMETGSFNNCSEFFKKGAIERKKLNKLNKL